MSMPSTRTGRGLIVAAASLLCALSAQAQEFPVKPIRIIVGNSPGTSQDLMARAMGAEMTKTLGQPIVVETKLGAQQTIAYEYVAKQVPNDGYTIVILAPAILATAPLMFKELRFDPLKDLPILIELGVIRLFLISPSAAPWKDFNEFAAYTKANPGKVNYGASTPPPRLNMEMVLRAKGLAGTFIPYKTTGQMIQALLANELQATVTSISDVLPHGDKLRVLAATGDAPFPALPNAPLFKSFGLTVRGASYALSAPAGVPQPVVDKLYTHAARALQTQPVQTLLANLKIEPTGVGPDVATRALADEAKAYAEVARQIGFKPE